MKSVLISTQPKWCEKICRKIGEQNGIPVYLKPVEVRKSAPKEVPFRAHLYCTNGRFDITDIDDLTNESVRVVSEGRGKVIGEFVCDKVDRFLCTSVPYQKHNNLGYGRFLDNGVYKVDGLEEGMVCERYDSYIDSMLNNNDLKEMCLSAQELFDYVGAYKHFYGWHISDLKIYDNPRELGEFSRYGYKDIEHAGSGCVFCGNTQCKYSNPEEVIAGHYIPPICKIDGCTLKRAPQSWQYVEEIEE